MLAAAADSTSLGGVRTVLARIGTETSFVGEDGVTLIGPGEPITAQRVDAAVADVVRRACDHLDEEWHALSSEPDAPPPARRSVLMDEYLYFLEPLDTQRAFAAYRQQGPLLAFANVCADSVAGATEGTSAADAQLKWLRTELKKVPAGYVEDDRLAAVLALAFLRGLNRKGVQVLERDLEIWYEVHHVRRPMPA